MEQISRSHVVIAPAISEFNPNFILEGLAMGRPALISQGSGLSVTLPSEWQFDPFDAESITHALRLMAEHYPEALRQQEKLALDITWEKVLGEHERFVREAIRHE
jgi:glycosyltransferase involved in cell wall biosynthesis